MRCNGIDCPWKKKYDDFMKKGGVKGLQEEIARKNRKILKLQG